MWIGKPEQARAEAMRVKLAPNRGCQGDGGAGLARAGDTAGAEKLAAELDGPFPLDTLVQRYWLPTIRGGRRPGTPRPQPGHRPVEGGEHDRTERPNRNLAILWSPLMCVGKPIFTLHDGYRAAAEFRKFIETPGDWW